MRLGEIDLSLKPLAPKFQLCRPDKTVISPLKDIHSVSLSVKLGKVNELNFTIPSLIERNHELIDNPLIDIIKHRYLVKLELNHQIEYFVFLEQNKEFQDNGEIISYRLFSLGYLLADKIVRNYEATSKMLTEIASEILRETNWKVGYIDSFFNTKFRSHEISSSTVLQAIYDLADKFNAVLIWNTEDLTIDFFVPSNIGMNKGLKFKEGKYLESFSVSTNSEEIVTRLRVYGKDGLTFRKLSPTGVNYLEDFSYFIYGFERDVNGNVIKHSDYFSDGLCIALDNYYKFLASKTGTFEDLTSQLTGKEDIIQQENEALAGLKRELAQIMDELDINNSNVQNPTSNPTLIARRKQVEDQISAKEIQILTLEDERDDLQLAIDEFRGSINIASHLTPANLLELNPFIIEKDYTNDTIVDEEDLLEDGLKAFEDMREPKINLSLNIISFLSVVEAQHDWNKLSLGDIVKLDSKRLRVGIEAKIIEINYQFDNDSISLTIANEKELKDDYSKLMDLIYNANATSTVVNMDKYKWDMIEEATGLVDQLYYGVINTIKNQIIAGYQQNIEISERGILVRSPSNPLDVLIIQNGMLAISNDGQNTWKHAVTSTGIVGDLIIGKLIMGTRLMIEDENGIIRLSGSLQEVFNKNGEVKVELGEYEPNKYGLRIHNGSIEIVNGLPKNQIDPTAVTQWDSAEQNAKKYADEQITAINTAIGNLSSDVEDLQSEIQEGFRDGIIEEAEAIAIEKYLNELTATKGILDSQYTSIYADTALSSTSKTALATSKTNFNTSYTNLINSINTAINDKKTTVAEKTDVDAKFTDYKSKINDLQKKLQDAILEIQVAREKNAKDYTDQQILAVNTSIESVRGDVTDLQNEISEGFRDGIIEESEAIAIEKYINDLSISKGNLDNQYTPIYEDTNLSNATKTSLASTKTSFNTAYTNLINSINAAISDKKTTTTEKNDVDSKFTIYKNSINDLSLKLQQAILEIQTAKSDKAKQDAIDHANTNNTTIRTDLRLTASLPTSITMNANGITATTTANADNFARLDYRGLYVQNGAIDIRTGTATNRGVIFDGNGIRGYNSSGTKTFEIDSNGNAIFSGSLSGATGTFSGSLSAASGTFSGTLSAANGSFSGTLNGASGTFSGTLSGNSITGATISGGSITGTTITTDTDIYVGNNMYLAYQYSNRFVDKGVIFAQDNNQQNVTKLTGTYLKMDITAPAINLYSQNASGNTGMVDVYATALRLMNSTQLTVLGHAYFASTIDFSSASSINWGSHKPSATWG